MATRISAWLIIAIVAAMAMTASSAHAKETRFIEMAAVLGVYRDVCREEVSDDTILTAIGSAMIEEALSREAVINRSTKRAHHILKHVLAGHTEQTFCGAIKYYLDHGYPK